MSTHSFEVELNTEYRTAVRFPAWMVLSVFSAVALAALSARFKKDDRGADARWAMAVTTLSMVFGLFGNLGYLFVRGIFVGQLPEMVLIGLVLAFWGLGLPAIMNPNHGIAVRVADGDVEVDNANLYFSSWISFAAAVFLAGSLAQETMGLDVRTAPAKQSRWFALSASSMVVLFASVRIHRNDEVNCGGSPGAFDDFADNQAAGTLAGTEFCKRVNLGIALGVITFVLSLLTTFAAAIPGLNLILSSGGIVELAVSALLLVMWCFGVGFITFGGDLSPGTHIGNLYFATWICFGMAVAIFAAAFRDFVGGPPQTTTSPDANGDPELGTPAPPPNSIPEDDDL